VATINKPFTTKNDVEASGVLKSLNSAANEGGEIQLALPSSGSTLSGPIVIDVYQDKFRIFDSVSLKGAYIDLTAAGATVGSNLLAGGGGGATTLDGLTDVAISTPPTGAFLRYSGTEWVDSDQTITLGGNFTTSGAFAITLTATATTSLTLPTTGTLATLDGNETFTNKTLTSPVLNTPSLTLSTTSSTDDGRLSWDTTYHHSLIGDGTNSRVVSTLPGYAIAAKTSGSPYTLLAADANTIIRINTAGAYTVNIPTNSTAYTIGTQIHFVQTGNGQVTIQALTSGTTTIISTGATTTAPKLRTTNSMATAIKLDTETWIVTGDVV